MAHPITKRHCHYCAIPLGAAFYLPAPIRGWACPSCYFEVATSRPSSHSTSNPNGSSTHLMATEGAVDALLELAGVA